MGTDGGGTAGKVTAGVVARLLAARGEPLSGEALARGLGVSRAAVWKAVQRLREQGYLIRARTSRGYVLAPWPDLLSKAEVEARLGTVRLGRPFVHLTRARSTNDEAARLAEAGAPEGTLVAADAQEAGRGRLGRAWHSPPARNLYASFVLRPPLPPHSAPALTLVAGVAAAEALAGAAGLAARLKWPNDVWVRGRKIAGILTEMRAEADRVHFVVVGIGLNVNAGRGDFPASLRETATSVRIETGERTSRAALLAALCAGLERWYDRFLEAGFGPVAEAFRGLSVLDGAEVRVDGPEGRAIQGIAEGIDGEGALLVRASGGRIERVLAGDVHLCRSLE